MADRGARYQISGPNAFHRYGWTEQVPNRLYVYNDRISGARRIGPVAMTLIKVHDERLGGTEVVRTPDGVALVYASKARSLVDAVYDWSRFETLPQAFDWIRREVKTDDAFAAELVRMAIPFGNQGTLRRIGRVLEESLVAEHLLRRLERQIQPSTSFIPWIPGRQKRGTIDKRWGVVINDGR
jgi:predicted transcriptional regulator of viral defense system